MKKSIICFVAALIFAVELIALPGDLLVLKSQALSYEKPSRISDFLNTDDYYYHLLRDKTIELTQYKGSDKIITIPKELDGKTVSVINERCFSYNEDITSITIPNTIKYIGTAAFYAMDGLTTLNIPESVEIIEPGAFAGNENLTLTLSPKNKSFEFVDGFLVRKGNPEIISCPTGGDGKLVIPKGIKSIGDSVFGGMDKITSVTIPETVENIGEYAFSGCTNLSSVTIPKSVKTIGMSAFDSCNSLTAITIPKGVKIIEHGTFGYCYSLTSVKISDGVTKIGGSAFSGCRSLTDIALPESITEIGMAAFSGCSSLESVNIPSGVKSIGVRVFYGCESLESVKIPSGVTEIGENAFSECFSLKSITIPSSVKSIDTTAFDLCGALSVNVSSKNKNYEVVNGNLIDKKTSEIIFMTQSGGDFVLPSGTKYIKDSAFSGNMDITSVTIPDSVEYIGDFAFEECENLTSVTIPSSVKSIGIGAFYNCTKLTSITIPSSVEFIDDLAFRGCESLTSVKLHKGLKNIGRSAFEFCQSLTLITIPSGVKTIGNSAFQSCKSLTSIKFSSGVTSIGQNAFMDCVNLSSAKLPKSLKVISDSMFYGCSALSSIELHDNITSIGTSAFLGCESLKSLRIPKKTTSIGDTAFGLCDLKITIASGNKNFVDSDGVLLSKDKTQLIYCSREKSGTYKIPDTVKKVNPYTFYGCSKLTSVIIPDSITDIGEEAFAKCSITSVAIPDSVKLIDIGAFADCRMLTSVKLSKNIETLSSGLFSGCAKLEFIMIPEGVKTICYTVFDGCKSLTTLTIPESVETIDPYSISNCDYIDSITFKSAKSPDIDPYIFEGSYVSKIYIPEGSKDSYDSNINQDASPYNIDGIQVAEVGKNKMPLPEYSETKKAADISQYEISSAISVNTDGHIGNWANVSPISQFVDNNNRISYAYAEYNSSSGNGDNSFRIISVAQYVYIDKLNEDLTLNKRLKIKAMYSLIGSVTCDEAGYYYIVWGNPDYDKVGNVETIAVSKYDNNGNHIKTAALKSVADSGSGRLNTRIPFEGGNCAVAIHNGVLVCNYARAMYNGHQSNAIIAVNTDTMETITGEEYEYYSSHSFDQRVMYSEKENRFIYASHGDSFPRGFDVDTFTPFTFTQVNYMDMSRLNYTNAQLGGIGEVSTGTVLVAASAPALTADFINQSKQLFIQIFDINNKKQVLKGDSRIFINEFTEEGYDYSTYESDKGIKWLTDYTDLNVENPQMVVTDDDKIVILWEAFEGQKFSTYKESLKINHYECYSFVESFYMVLSSKGDILQDVTSMGKTRLNAFEEPFYIDGCVYWVTASGESDSRPGTIKINKVNIDSSKNAYTVRFSLNGDMGIIPTQFLKSGSKITEPAEPTRNGYTFGGWYKEASCKTKWNTAKDKLTKNTTLYAKWIKNSIETR